VQNPAAGDDAFAGRVRRFSFEAGAVHGPRSSQQEIFEGRPAAVVDAVLQGRNGTILAYGQVQCFFVACGVCGLCVFLLVKM
jgi:hypothetical protein